MSDNINMVDALHKTIYKQDQRISELEAENERLKKENSDMNTAVNQTIVNTLTIIEDNNRLRTCIDNRIVELQQQLKTPSKCARRLENLLMIPINNSVFLTRLI